MKHVLIVQRRMTHYRVPLFDALRHECSGRGVQLSVAYGQGTEEEELKSDGAHLDWGTLLPCRYILGNRLCWQPFQKLLEGVDMVVVTQENKLISNLITQYFDRRVRLGLWGHGANLQGDASSIRERFKRSSSRCADWWFAYTDLSVSLIKETGFPEERITVLNNSIDTSEMRELACGVEESDRVRWRAVLGLKGRDTGIFVGSLYEEKRIDFMLEAARVIRQRVPSFEFLIVGTGPKADAVSDFCSKNPWARYLGPRMGREKVELLSLASVMLNPGGVGLGILDSFVCGVPMVTTDCGLHGPEISYLSNGYNGLMTMSDIDSYVTAVVRLLGDHGFRQSMVQGCDSSGRHYSMGNMARNFADGIDACLSTALLR